MYFHASQTPNIERLTPHVSNHGTPLVYLSKKRENTLVYLSNAVEKYCKQVQFAHQGGYQTWASYGFTKDGILQLEEYYDNATIDTYRGVSGYIYSVEASADCKAQQDIPFAFTADHPVRVVDCIYIPDAYDAIMDAVEKGQIVLRRYADNSAKMTKWINDAITADYKAAAQHPEYQAFLCAKFDFLTK